LRNLQNCLIMTQFGFELAFQCANFAIKMELSVKKIR
jgi:hypothetical protein